MKPTNIIKILIHKGTTKSNVKTGVNRLKVTEGKNYAKKNFEWIKKKIQENDKKEEEKKEKRRIKEKAKKFNVPQKDIRPLEKKAGRILRNFPSDYLMGETRSLYVAGKMFFGSDYTAEYSGKWKGKEKHGKVNVNITKKDFLNLKIIGGIPTLEEGKTADPKIKKCRILQDKSKRQYENKINWGRKFLTSNFHANSIEAAKEWRKIRAEALWQQRRDEKRKRENKKAKLEKAKSIFIGLQHSTEAGNCKEGSKSFAKRHNLNPKNGYRLDYLIKLEPKNSFLNRILKKFEKK